MALLGEHKGHHNYGRDIAIGVASATLFYIGLNVAPKLLPNSNGEPGAAPPPPGAAENNGGIANLAPSSAPDAPLFTPTVVSTPLPDRGSLNVSFPPESPIATETQNTKHYLQPDGSFKFDYPDNLRVLVDNDSAPLEIILTMDIDPSDPYQGNIRISRDILDSSQISGYKDNATSQLAEASSNLAPGLQFIAMGIPDESTIPEGTQDVSTQTLILKDLTNGKTVFQQISYFREGNLGFKRTVTYYENPSTGLPENQNFLSARNQIENTFSIGKIAQETYSPTSSTSEIPQGFEEYTSDYYKFSMLVPIEWTHSEPPQNLTGFDSFTKIGEGDAGTLEGLAVRFYQHDLGSLENYISVVQAQFGGAENTSDPIPTTFNGRPAYSISGASDGEVQEIVFYYNNGQMVEIGWLAKPDLKNDAKSVFTIAENSFKDLTP